MAGIDNQVQARILLRYATYSQWMSSSVILLPGEAAIASFPRINTIQNTDSTPENTPPAIGIKIGDGVHYFDELPWVQGIAADVYNWAKASTKPTYSATEIVGLADYIASHGGGGGGSGGTTGSAYRIIYDANTSKYILQTYDDTQQEWVNTSSEIDLAQILNRINTIERWANGARTNLGNIELPIVEYIYEEVLNYLNTLDYNDQAQPHQFVTSVTETNGVIAVTRSTISISDITGVLPTSQGGTGITRVEDDELLIGSLSGDLQVRRFVTHIEEDQRNLFATTGAIIDYVLQQTAGLTGAMHFIGESTVVITNNSRIDPLISGYNFSHAELGDVILYNAQEYVWTGDAWRLLGDEGSYAIKGSIVNSDIAENANISQSKIADLTDTLNNKVTKVEGKQLSTNDYTTEDKTKLDEIEAHAQVNLIEHVVFNGDEIRPTTVNGLPKTISIEFNGMSAEQSEKLANIEPYAQVNTITGITLNGDVVPITNKIAAITTDPHTEHENKIEQIFINGTEYPPDKQKAVNITLDEAALNLEIVNGAIVPSVNGTEEVNIVNKKLELARIAKTGDVSSLLQAEDTYITLNCGSSIDVI